MIMKGISHFFGLALGIAVLGWGCGGSDEVDISTPTMQIISFVPAPAPSPVCGAVEDSVFTVVGGEVLAASLRFVDDRALSQYKIDIHNNFDCHGHGGSSAPGIAVQDVSSQTEDWTVLDIQALSGESAEEQLQLLAPQNVTAGFYHFQVQVIDESGNDNPLANFYTIRAFNPTDQEAPEIQLSSPQAGNTITVAKGAQISFVGTVTDNYSLSEGGNGVVFLSYTDLSSGNTFNANTYEIFPGEVEKDYNFNLEYTIPQTLKAGNYRFRIDAHDGVRNTADPIIFEAVITD